MDTTRFMNIVIFFIVAIAFAWYLEERKNPEQ